MEHARLETCHGMAAVGAIGSLVDESNQTGSIMANSWQNGKGRQGSRQNGNGRAMIANGSKYHDHMRSRNRMIAAEKAMVGLMDGPPR